MTKAPTRIAVVRSSDGTAVIRITDPRDGVVEYVIDSWEHALEIVEGDDANYTRDSR